MPAAEDRPVHLEPSELGTKEYWDKLYTSELENHAADPSDIGTVWFDDSDAEVKMVDFLGGLCDGDSIPQVEAPLRERSSLLDLGCGNGSLLFALRDAGWAGRALGVDYSAQSVALARRVGASRGARAREVELAEWDVVGGALDAVLDGAQARGWDVALDKGTFDAVSLSGGRDGDGGRLCEGYAARVRDLVRPGGLFLLTSCNWTADELVRWFAAPPDPAFAVVGAVPYRSFDFGGVRGQAISTLCFRRL